jgi:hypothetical protein
MPHYARTYGSSIYDTDPQNAWKFPTGSLLDSFGVPIGNRTFGLEEFNFSNFYLQQKLAFIPCYGSARTYPRPFIEELRLIFRIPSKEKFCYFHYATMFNVTSLINYDIPKLRAIILPMIDEIYFTPKVYDFFGKDYEKYVKQIRQMSHSSFIANNEDNNSFLVSSKYESIDILKTPIKCKMRSNFASNWYENVEYNCLCL